MQLFNNLKVRKKFFAVFSLLFVFVAIMILTSVYKLKSLNSDMNDLVNKYYVIIDKFTNVENDVQEIATALRNMLITDDKQTNENTIREIRTIQEQIKADLDAAEQRITSEAGKKSIEELRNLRQAYIQAREVQFKLFNEGKKKEATEALLTKVSAAQKVYLDAIRVTIKIQKEQMDKRVKDANNAYTNSVITTVILSFILIAVMIFSVMVLNKSIVNPLQESADLAKSISEGNLTLKIEQKSSDEIGVLVQSLETMRQMLRQNISMISNSSSQLASASEELSVTVEQMSERIEDQANKTAQVATATTEMSQTVIDIARNASNIAGSASDTLDSANNGMQVVTNTVNDVQDIAKTVSDLSGSMLSLGDRSKQIGEIVSVIKDIADQTNLLALNAAIEAARAGELGRGFAVVADEVRKLAERTGKATSEIGEMIGAMQTDVGEAVSSMSEASDKVMSGVDEATKAGDALTGIVSNVQNLQSMVQQIASATEEMSTVSEQISGDIEVIASVSTETSTNSTQIAEASRDLSKLSAELKGVVGKFRI